MKIAQVTPYDMSHPGGVAQHIENLKREFERLGHEVVVLAPKARQGGVEINEGFYGVGRTIPIPANGSKARLMFDVTLYNVIKEILQYEKFDVIHCHEPMTPLLPYMVLLNSRTVNVATFHAARDTNPWYGMLKPYFSILMNRLNGKICVSEPARQHMLQYFAGHYDVVPNGIDVERFGNHIEPFPWVSPGTPRILFVGRYNEARKGFKYLLRAMPLVHQQFPNAKLMVVGPGHRERFAETIDRYQIRNVEFVGEVSQESLPHYYASCDVFCAPSIHRESFGIVLLEGMASMKPVVASDIPGYASVATNNKDALLVPPRDSSAIALAIVRLLADAELRAQLVAAGQKTADHYSWPRVAQRVLDVYARSGAAVTT
ncbi:MAG: glycosyltransferase family 4 protein [Thermomicrobiales bacterium]|nr:glycosyltransferase family 4 protein [Thermomicrobiales bacterium]MCO5220808.1 glycosyltransferase family 4 protein [Thermomicrobiales bacterium]